MVKVKRKREEANRMWEDSEVLQLITLKGEMKPKLKRNDKKQGNFLYPNCEFCKNVDDWGLEIRDWRLGAN